VSQGFSFQFCYIKNLDKISPKTRKIKIEFTLEKLTKSLFVGKTTNMSQRNTYTSRFYLKLNLGLARQKNISTF